MNRVARQNVTILMMAAPEIVRRLRETDVTATAIRAEYGCGHALLKRAILSQGVTEAEFRALMLKRVSHPGGTASSFRKGHITWNAGKKGWCPPGCRATQFKTGTLRGRAARRYRAIGAIVLRKGKRLSIQERARRRQPERWIKIRDDGRKRWVRLAQYVWEREHGPVPKGCFVGHANNNLLDDSPDNLILIRSRREHCLRLYQRPEVVAKCRARAGVAAKRRHAQNRAAKKWAKTQQQQTQHRYECVGCAADFDRPIEQCPKCGAVVVQQEAAPMPESMEKEAFMCTVEAV